MADFDPDIPEDLEDDEFCEECGEPLDECVCDEDDEDEDDYSDSDEEE
jgi:hypothetical protein